MRVFVCAFQHCLIDICTHDHRIRNLIMSFEFEILIPNFWNIRFKALYQFSYILNI